MVTVRLDLNDPDLKAALVQMSERGRKETLGTFRKIVQMTWQQVYRDKGLNWEKVKSRPGPAGQSLYSFRISLKIRAVAYRHGDFMRVLTVHEDHDSAYTWPAIR
ncbi:MAG: hypothetical protein ACRER1_00250 [Gammaproteobacteria bacterium]